MIFEDRTEAAHLLAAQLKNYRGQNPLVLGIPRGAIPIAKIVADELNGELGAILVHKIPAPGYPELAVGAVGLSGKVFRLPLVEELGVSEEYLQAAAKEQVRILKKRKGLFQIGYPQCQDRLVIIVDDGIATGASVMGAILEVRSQKPRELVVATPTIAHSTALEVRPLVEKLVALQEPESFYAVSQFYADFSQVTDEEVADILFLASQSNESSKGKPKEPRHEKHF